VATSPTRAVETRAVEALAAATLQHQVTAIVTEIRS